MLDYKQKSLGIEKGESRMTANKYEIALDVTKKNFDKIIREIPQSLQAREESLYEKLMISNLKPLKRLEVLYAEMDTIYSFVMKFSQCKKRM